MQQVIDEFIKSITPEYSMVSMYHFRYDLQSFNRFCEEKGVELTFLTQGDIECFLLNHSTAHMRMRRLRLLQRLYTFCGVAREKNPAFAVRVRVRGLRRKVPWQVPSVEQVNALCANIQSSSELCRVRNRLLVELAYGSGLRRKELVSINIEDIDTSARTIRVLGKGSKPRIVPVTQNALVILAQYLKRREVYQGALFVSATTGKRLTVRGLSVVFLKSIGIRPHLLRHACATHMLENGCSIMILQELLGHTHVVTTQQYTKVSKKHLAVIVKKIHPRSAREEEKGGE